MSFAEARIREYLASADAVDIEFTEVRFARIGDLEIGIAPSKNRQKASEPEVTEDEIERQLSNEGLIRVPQTNRTRNEFTPIDVEGKPISEMIIEERR